MEFKDTLRELRKAHGLTQKELANRADLTVGTIQRYELGTRKPSFEALQSIAKVLGMNLIDFKSFLDDTPADRQRLEIVEPVPDQRERELIDNYHQLNDEGQEYLVTQSRFLLTEERYKKEDRVSS